MGDIIKEYLEVGKKNIILIYALFLLGLIAPFLPIIGGILAFLNKDTSNKIWQSHYRFAFRTFIAPFIAWISITLLLPVFIFITSFISHWLFMVGAFFYMIMNIAILAWFFVRTIIALQLILTDKTHPNPLTLWIK